MARRKNSIFYELVQSLKNQQAFGQSKHAVKRHAIEIARAQRKTGKEIWKAMNDAIFQTGIFSFETYRNYRKIVRDFSEFCKINGVTRDMAKAKELVPEFLEKSVDRNSAWTVKLQRAALRKAFRDQELAKDVKIQDRKKEDISRSRHTNTNSKVYRENKNIMDFAKATGLRRRELASVRTKDIYVREDKLYVHVQRGKGGKIRDAPVLAGYQDQVLKIIQNCEGNDKIFNYIPQKMDIHCFRREYAQERYRELERERDKEPEKEKDREREIIREISHDLGHGRTDVVTIHYL